VVSLIIDFRTEGRRKKFNELVGNTWPSQANPTSDPNCQRGLRSHQHKNGCTHAGISTSRESDSPAMSALEVAGKKVSALSVPPRQPYSLLRGCGDTKQLCASTLKAENMRQQKLKPVTDVYHRERGIKENK
jgi:hypothetical protein